MAIASDENTESGQSIWRGSYLPMTLANLAVIALVAFSGLAIVAALSSIAEDLGQLGLLPWVITGYLASGAVALIFAGPVIDAVGVRRTFRVTGLWLLVSTAAAAASPTMSVLIVARVIQGFGGGLVFAVAFTAIGVGYPHELRPRAFTAQSVVFGVGALGGPAIAGAILVIGGWRMIFLAELPLITLALAVGWSALPTTRERPERIQIDWIGAGLLTVLIACSLVAVAQIGVRLWLVAGALLITGLLVAIYWVHSGRVESPVVARDHLTRFPLAWVHLTSGLVMFVGLGLENYIPLYVQTARDRSVEFAAFSLMFLSAGWTVGSLIYSRVLDKWPESDVILLGCALFIPSIGLAGATIALTWSLPLLFCALALIGLSIGLVTTPGFTLLHANSELSEMGRVTAVHQLVRQLAITYGVALSSAILFFVVDYQVGDVEALREVIAGDEIALGREATDAIRDGMAWAHLLIGSLSVVCMLAGLSLVRRTRALAAANSLS